MEPSDTAKPLMIYDGDCSFCKAWIEYWRALSGDRVSYAPYQQVADSHPSIPREDFRRAVQLVLPWGEVVSGAHAVFQSLALAGNKVWLLRAYQRLPGFAAVTEGAYSVIARHRNLAWRLTKLAFGRKIVPLEYRAIEWLFLKILAITYLVAFLSFDVQIQGLIGADGISPAAVYLRRAAEYLPGSHFWRVPTIFWLSATDASLRIVCGLGVLAAASLLFGFARRTMLIAAPVIYLSLISAGQEFMSFQWDALLIETGFLAIFLGWSPVMPWLFRWLLFRLIFQSGCVKLLSGDPTWRNLTALTYHYQTQPIPNPIAWYMQQLPVWFQKCSCVVMFGGELLAPFLLFAPRRIRHFGAGCLAGLQVLIAATGNFAFFNLLALSLCLFAFDDASLRRLLPARVLAPARTPMRIRMPLPVRRVAVTVVAVIVLAAGASCLIHMFAGTALVVGDSVISLLAPLDIVNSYGLFAVMTTTRPEIILEGSNDGKDWREYVFRYKPGPLDRRPPFVAPHQPRLDWQMWFAALGTYRDNPWFVNFVYRLLEGSPEVVALVEGDPFPGKPPRFIRAILYEYRFTDWSTRRRTGAWWTRQPMGTYLRAVSLSDFTTSS